MCVQTDSFNVPRSVSQFVYFSVLNWFINMCYIVLRMNYFSITLLIKFFINTFLCGLKKHQTTRGNFFTYLILNQ